MNNEKKYFKKFCKNFIEPSFHMKNKIDIYKTGIDHPSLNFCFLENDISESDVNYIYENLDTGVLLSEKKLKNDFDYKDKIYYLGEYPFMLRNESRDPYSAPFYDDVQVLAIREYPGAFKDFLKVLSDIKNINSDDFFKKIELNNLTHDNHFFVAYISEIPVGCFYAISDGEDAFIIEAIVKKEFRNSGILTAMAKSAREEAIKNGVYNFYSIPTSEFSIKVMADHGYRRIGSYHIWQKVK